MRDPRHQHYAFAHVALPSLFFRDPEAFIAILNESKGNVLNDLWGYVGQNMRWPHLVTAGGLGCEIRNLDAQTTIALITLPAPQAITEAYFVALVYRPQKRGVLPAREALARCFTLECGIEVGGGSRTVLCEWTKDHMHINRGDGPAPTPDAFLEAICDLTAG